MRMLNFDYSLSYFHKQNDWWPATVHSSLNIQSIKTSYSSHHPCLKNMPRLAAKTCVMPEHWVNNQLPNCCSISLTEIDRESETNKSSKSCSLPCLFNQNIFPSKRLFSPHKNDAYKKIFPSSTSSFALNSILINHLRSKHTQKSMGQKKKNC